MHGIPVPIISKILLSPKRKHCESAEIAKALLGEAAGYASGFGFRDIRILSTDLLIILTMNNPDINTGLYLGYEKKGSGFSKIEGMAMALNAVDPYQDALKLFGDERPEIKELAL
jgi:hypothetical protein